MVSPPPTIQLTGPATDYQGPSPLPFFGRQATLPWVRPGLGTFSTFLNQGGGSSGLVQATVLDNPAGLPLVLSAPADGGAAGGFGNQILTGLLKPAPKVPWTLTVGHASFSLAGAGWGVPIILYDTAGNKAESFEWGYPAIPLQVLQWTGVSTVSVSLPSVNGVAPTGGTLYDYFTWFRVVNDGVHLTYSVGPDGIIFQQSYQESVNSFLGTIDKIGFGVDRYSTTETANLNSSILWSWVES